MSTYLVTGGAGFIGSYLVDKLIELKHEVIVLDNLSTGKIQNINPECQFVKGDINDSAILKILFAKVDFCYHLAATASVQKSIDNWLECHNNNLTGTINVFSEAAKNNVPVVYASSAAIYGTTAVIPINENTNIEPESPYGLDKYCCELQAKMFAKVYGLHTLGLRFFNVYGKRQDPHSPYSGVISIFIDRIKNNLPIEIFGDGKQQRDFVFVDDIVKALISAEYHVSTKADALNVCTGRGVFINELAEILFKLSNNPSNIKYYPAKVGDIYKSIGNPQKMLDLLGFKANINIEEGVSKLL